MPENKKSRSMQIAQTDVDFEKSVDQLTDAILEDLKASYKSDLEPFEAYAARVRAQIHENMDDFRDRFLQGYEILIQEISKQYERSTPKDMQAPPDGIKL